MRLAPGAYDYAAIPAVLALVALVAFPPASLVALALAGFVLLFFRDPERVPVEGAARSAALAAADGTVSVIRTEEDDDGRERVRVGVFMNVTDVHVNRVPLPGTVADVEHVPGGHLPAFSKEAERNERLHVDLVDESAPADSEPYRVTQIAGTVARRCHSYVQSGDALARGERFGHIAFSSRVDVLLPPRFGPEDLLVEEGDGTRAGRTVLATDPAARVSDDD
ncbi:phosphatidylserine decarboxylase [Halorubellus sp. JP-L1]|uniref:protein sorting system archaetidylserine decarboxylase n=1 Tax=Halorubellus sp. JP-L1 TaxID=2715753 RepID=UPI0014085C50|nr:protein sorting system archaetidylserine decarboxylase [Halorubellus sp. JP-L1]NHN40876.1 phosphatidylserine decarboxylase [Halorubellus sp. JP-L1]